MQLPFFDMVERARKMISFYGIYQANDKIELAELKSNHLRQEIMKLKNQMLSYDSKLEDNLKRYEEQSDTKRNDLLKKVNSSKQSTDEEIMRLQMFLEEMQIDISKTYRAYNHDESAPLISYFEQPKASIQKKED